jgi:hypothetical protein
MSCEYMIVFIPGKLFVFELTDVMQDDVWIMNMLLFFIYIFGCTTDFVCVCTMAVRNEEKGNSSTITYSLRDHKYNQSLITQWSYVKERKKHAVNHTLYFLFSIRTEQNTPTKAEVCGRRKGVVHALGLWSWKMMT